MSDQPPDPWQAPTPGPPEPAATQPVVPQPPATAQPPDAPPPYAQPQYGQPQYPQPQYGQPPAQPPAYGYGQEMAPYQGGPAPIGKVRSTGICILLAIVTLGIYQYVWFFKVHSEMKRHTGQGLGGGVALVLTIFVSIAMPYITSSEVGGLYSRRGQQPPVTGLTGLWYFPGMLIIVGPIVWFVKTNGALNAYWRSLGAAG
jgi:hypothetical protein